MNEEQTSPEPEAIIEEEQMPILPQSALPFPDTVDLNETFPEEETDLNDLFPDEETKVLLKKIQRNKKDLHTMIDRFTEEENWSGESSESSDEEPDEPPPPPPPPPPQRGKQRNHRAF